MVHRKHLRSHFFVLLGMIVMATLAVIPPASAGSLISQSISGIAIKGYDPVAYFTQNKAIKGSEQFSYKWLGATWHFATADHRKKFVADPIRYAPQFGGYCASNMTTGARDPADPLAWRIVDGKLYLNYSREIATSWAKNSSRNIVAANRKWSEVKKNLTQ